MAFHTSDYATQYCWYTNFLSTEFVALNNFQMLVDGGTAGMFWSYTWIIIGQFFIVISLAEMASMAPTAGG
jgi:amino acid permease